MFRFRYFQITIFVALLLTACNPKTGEDLFSLKTEGDRVRYQLNEQPVFRIDNPAGKRIDSVVYHVGDKRLGSVTGIAFTANITACKVGRQMARAEVYFDGTSQMTTQELVLLADRKPVVYDYRIVNTFPHDIDAYTQGLEFYRDTLYESTGQYGHSSLRKTDYQTGQVLQQHALERHYFGEGLTLMDGKVYQLTWRENRGFVYDAHSLEPLGNFAYGQSKEGWGLCNDSNKLYKSDGTEKIWTLHPETLAEEDYIQIYTNTSRIKSVNELEWVEGMIFANVYQQSSIAIIKPENGVVAGVIDLKSLQKHVTQHPKIDVLNGIAYKGTPGRLFLTGKNWDKLFEIEYFEKQ